VNGATIRAGPSPPGTRHETGLPPRESPEAVVSKTARRRHVVKSRSTLTLGLVFGLVLVSLAVPFAEGQALKTPLKPETLSLLANEISGQMVFNNQVKLAGAPWMRDPQEFTGTFYETQQIYDLVRSYGVETSRITKYPTDKTFEYPAEGEFWALEPERRLIARLGADAALVAAGSSSADITGELIYLPPMSDDEAKRMMAAGPQEKYRGKLALMWSHVRDDMAKALDAAGIQGVISFNSRERYFDPNQVVYSSGSYSKNQNLKVGLTISWRQWSELLEDVDSGKKVVVRAKTRIESHADRFEAVFSWIPGAEPDAKGIVFTGHLFEGYTKRGANDDMSGCVVQLEILRALNKLIATGQLPKPRRTIYFLWPNEISGTYEFIKQSAGFADKLSININMDMVGEALRKNNAWFTMSETPDHLPSYLDGLAKSMLSYVWRTNDIVYLPDAPRGRPGGQYFPTPMWEKNGSLDAFRFYIHRATGGSDHICFDNPSVGVPGIEFFTWPDQWYHADTDNPDKGDPTEMKRIAFVGAAAAWAAANATDEVVAGLVDATSEFGYGRIAERELPRAMEFIETADGNQLSAVTANALNLVGFAVDREIGALRSIEEIYTGSPSAKASVDNRVRQWELYRAGLKAQVLGYGKLRAEQLKAKVPLELKPTLVEQKYETVVPAIAASVKNREFALANNTAYAQYAKDHADELKQLGLTPEVTASILNFVNGRRSLATIFHSVTAQTGRDVPLDSVVRYLDELKKVGWITY
jgi:aminopeptidase YwaD